MSATLNGDEIELRFSYDPEMVSKVRLIPDRVWQPAPRKLWTVPATPFHARQVMEMLGNDITIGRDVQFLAQKDQRSWLTSDLDLSVGDLTPYPYQVAAVEFVHMTGGRCLISDEVGLGKTIEAIAYARYADLVHFLVVAPASVIYKWEREIIKWYPEMAGQVQVLLHRNEPITGQVVVCSYDIMTNQTRELIDQGYQLIILDEVQRIKSRKAQRAQAAKLLAPGIPHILGLSGTPIHNLTNSSFIRGIRNLTPVILIQLTLTGGCIEQL